MRTELRLPQEWQDKPSEVLIKSDAFEYKGVATWPERNRVILTDTYRTLADHVPAERVSEHSEKLGKAINSLGYTVYLPKAPGSPRTAMENFNWLVALIGLFFTATLCRLALAVYRYDPIPVSTSEADAHLRGIGGWLILAAMAAVGIALRTAKQIWESLPVLSHEPWTLLTTVGNESYSALWAPILLFELFAQLALLVFAILMLILFFGKRSSLPKVWICYCLSSLGILFFDMFLTSTLPATAGIDSAGPDSAALAKLVLGNLAWAAYFARSRRVRATFVRRLDKPQRDAGSASNLQSSATQVV